MKFALSPDGVGVTEHGPKLNLHHDGLGSVTTQLPLFKVNFIQ